MGNFQSKQVNVPWYKRPPHLSLVLGFCLLVGMLFLNVTLEMTPAAETVDSVGGDALRERAQGFFDRGQYEQAALTWSKTAQVFAQEGRVKEQTEALLYLGQSLYQMGQYRKAGATLELAAETAKQSKNTLHLAMTLGRLGNVAFALGHTKAANDYLTEGLALSRELNNDLLTASLLNDLGNVAASQKNYQEAVGMFTESRTLAQTHGHKVLEATALINSGWSALLDEQWEESQKQLDLAWSKVQTLENTHEKTRALLNIGLAYDRLGQSVQPPQPDLKRQAGKAFNQTAEIARGLQDPTMESYGWGYLGHLYEEDGQNKEALELSRRAIQAAQKGNAPESLYQWEWQVARLLNKTGNTKEALLAYRRAMYTLQPIRAEVTLGFQRQLESFRHSVGPLFFEYVDLLLKQADATTELPQQEPLLIQARATVEQFKTAELQDYFRDDCVDTAQSRQADIDQIIEELSKTTAVIYPIVLPDRLELLLTYHSGTKQELKRETVPVSSLVLTEEVRTFRRLLEKTNHQRVFASCPTTL